GLMMLGYCVGKLFSPTVEQPRRTSILTWGGIGLILFFIALRATNLYGDPDPWSAQKNTGFTILSFINTHKYPPSLLYMCMTIGPALLFLALSEKVRNKVADIFIVYGRVPFLYYILHFYILHSIRACLFIFHEGHSFREGINGSPNYPFH